MIHFVTTRDHAKCVTNLARRLGRGLCRQWQYERLFSHRRLPGGSWIFTDHERLSAYELAAAARVASLLSAGGARVLNHPARVKRRLDLLRALHAAGINSFTAWRADESPRPGRFPVFLRNDYDHLEPQGLLHDQAALDRELDTKMRAGESLAGKLVIEYAGQEIAPGLWQRFQAYNVGGRIIAHAHAAHFDWVVKNREDRRRLAAHPAFDSLMADERDFVVNNRYADILARVFALAGIDYGRVDFALLDGAPQIFEINTNPTHAEPRKLYRDIDPRRIDIQRHSEDAVEQAIRAVDSAPGHPVLLDDPVLRRSQRWRWRVHLRRSPWRP